MEGQTCSLCHLSGTVQYNRACFDNNAIQSCVCICNPDSLHLRLILMYLGNKLGQRKCVSPASSYSVTDRNQALRSRKTSTNLRRAVSSLGMSCLLIHRVAPVWKALVRFQSGFLVKPNHLERNSFVLYSCFI